MAAQACLRWTEHPCYSVVRVAVRDPEVFKRYAIGHAPTIAKAGGSFLVAGGSPEAVDSSWPVDKRVVVHRWPSSNDFFAWYESADYAEWKALRQLVSDAEVVLVQGGPDPPAFNLEETPTYFVAGLDAEAVAKLFEHQEKADVAEIGASVLSSDGRILVVEGAWTPRQLHIHRWASPESFWSFYLSQEGKAWRHLMTPGTEACIVQGLSAVAKQERGLP
ncbi:hypothetical protein DFJ74DRAFT_694477 [Hyaloraphidium curvatum]|nr:hypothetical protein DFJ74DRAFT_694477 [Hyaloraphidium curvatum]